MKIFYIFPVFGKPEMEGGALTHGKGFVNSAIELGHEVTVFAPSNFKWIPKKVKKEIIPITLSKNLFLQCFQRLSFERAVNVKIKELICKEKPDFICKRHELLTSVDSDIAKLVPYILEYNGPLDWVLKNWSEAGFKNFMKKIIAPYVGYCEAKAVRNATACFAQAVVNCRILEQKGVPKSKIFYNPNGVDLKRFNFNVKGNVIRNKLKLEKNIIVGFVASYGYWHGADVLAKSVQHAVKKTKTLHFLLIGNGMLRPNAEEIIKNTKMSNNTTFLDQIPNKDMPKYLSACDILVNPTKLNPDGTEFFGSPTKLLEYMAMQKAIVSSGMGQMKEILTDGESALLVPPEKPELLANAIVKLANDSKLRVKLGKNARKLVENEYNWKRNVERVVGFYEKHILVK